MIRASAEGPAAAVHWPDLATAVAGMTRLFREAGLDSPGLDARRLAAGTLGLEDATLLREPGRLLDASAGARLREAAARRLAREPVSRILGCRGFHGLAFEIGSATLDPRPETETLVDGVLGLVAEGAVPGGPAARILDLGTGSGAILIALLARLPDATGLGVDISEAALAVARRNAERHGVAARATFRRSCWLDAVSGTFDVVVANPPYIRREAIAELEPEVARFDPVTALDGGDDGLDAYRMIASAIGRVLARHGWLAVEVGTGQAGPVQAMFRHAGLGRGAGAMRIWPDLSGTSRCVAARA